MRAEPIALLTKNKAPEIIWDGVTSFPEWIGLSKQQRLILGSNKTEDRKTDMINLNLMTYALLPWLHKTKEDYDDYIEFIINDNGKGFKGLKNIKEILNPYFTTKKTGTGLGLAIVNKIINDHDGSIKFANLEDGAKVTVEFLKL